MNYSTTKENESLSRKSLPESRESCQAGLEYYMLDYLNNDDITHIRLPFLRREQLLDALQALYASIESGANISNIRVLPESFLDEPYANPKVAQAAIDAGIENAEHLEATTREVLFGWRYEQIAKSFKNRSLAKH